MESTSKIDNYIESMKSELDTMKIPLNHNLHKLNDIIDLFESATSALLNPIKKLKISYNMEINSFKGKYENVLASVKSKIYSLEKNKNVKESKNFSTIYIDETAQQNNEIQREHNKLMKLLEDCLQSISTLNNLFDTEEFLRLEEITKGLSSSKKKTKAPILGLNEDENEHEEQEEKEKSAGSHNGKINGKIIKSKEIKLF